MEQLTLPLLGLPAKSFRWPESETEWLGIEDGFISLSSMQLATWAHDGSLSRTSPAFYPFIEEGTSAAFSAKWLSSGLMAAHAGGCLTLRCSEYPKGVAVSTLSSIETIGDVPQRPCMTSRCANGLLRRVRKHGRKLPERLESALEDIVSRAHRPRQSRSRGGLSVTLTALHETPIFAYERDGEYVVERLTPEDYEVCQGLPVGWTRIPWKGKPAERCPARERCMAVGNAFPVPVIRWIGERINLVDSIKI